MTKALRYSADRLTTHLVVRVLIASYFMAAAIGLFPSTDLTVLTAPFLPEALATILPRAVMFILATMILAGVQRRGAALVLALMVFWASYMTLMSAHDAAGLGDFWRDLALIGALVLTYTEAEPTRTPGDPSLRARFKRISPGLAAGASGAITRISRPRSRLVSQPVSAKKELFREDLTAARSSSGV